MGNSGLDGFLFSLFDGLFEVSCPRAVTVGEPAVSLAPRSLPQRAWPRHGCVPLTSMLFVLPGGTLQGFISDVLQKRAPVLALSLFLAVGSLVGYSREYSFAAALVPDLLKVDPCPESAVSRGESRD